MAGEKIKIITYDNFPFGGASANLLRYLSLALAKTDNIVEVVLPTGNYYGKNVEGNPQKSGNVENVNYKHLGFRLHPLNYIGKILDNIFGLTLPIIYLYKECYKSNLDKIVLYGVSFNKLLIFIFIKITLEKKLIIFIPEYYEKPKGKYLSIPLLHWYDFYFGMKYLSRHADGYITSSHFLKKYMQNKQKVDKNILVLPNLMDPNIFQLSEVKPFLENKITIGYAGTPTRKDGAMDLIESFSVLNKKYPNTHLLIIGDVVDPKKTILPELKHRAMELGVDKNITFTGLMPFSRIPVLLNSCQILALTRPNGIFAEAGFPTKLGEYFACKKPVLITRVGDIPLYFKNNEHVVIVNPEDIDSIVRGFEQIINSEELSSRLSINGYNWMNNNLNYRNLSSKVSGFVNHI